MNLDATYFQELKKKYRGLFISLENNPQHYGIERTLMGIQQEIIKLRALDIKKLRAPLRKAAQTSIAVLMNFEGKIRGLRKQGAGASSSAVSTNQPVVNKIKWIDLENAFEHRINTGMILNENHKDLVSFLNDAKKMLVQKIQNILKRKNAVKVNTTLALDYIIKKNNDEEEIETKFFTDGSMEILQSTNLNQIFTENLEILKNKHEESETHGSGWTLFQILHLEVHVYDYIPLQGGNSFIEMPQWIINTKSVINVQNNDDFCFVWSVLAALHPNKQNPTRVTSYYKYSGELILDGITFPISWEQIDKFEKLNNLKVNIYGIELKESYSKDDVNNLIDGGAVGEREKNEVERGRIVPLYISNNVSNRETIHLLMINNDDNDDEEEENEEVYEDYYEQNNFNRRRELTSYHFAWIKNLSRLTSSQISKHKTAKKICDRCLCHFQTQQSFDNHSPQCKEKNTYRMLLPTKYNNILKFRNYKYQLEAPFIIYCDSEAILEKTNDDTDENMQRNESKKTRILQKHIPCSIASYMVCSYNSDLNRFKLHRGLNCIENFIDDLKNIAYEVDEILKDIKPMDLSEEEELDFLNATECYICKKPFTDQSVRVRDHDHKTSAYRGCAHRECNLLHQDSHIIPIVIHNLKYDSHFFIKQLQSQFPGKIDLLAVTKENYISFTKHVENTRIKLRFIDSFRFSLDALAAEISNTEKKITRQLCETDEQFQLLTKKGVYCYEYIDNWEKFNETELPPKDEFYSQLNNEHKSDDEYNHACKVWDVFEIQNLGEYSDLYLRTDVTLLADIFESFRKDTLNIYGLDPAHYLTLPGLSWDAMLKLTNIELELLTDPEMILFIEQGIRGGFCQCSKRYAKANNKYMGEKYDVSKEDSYLIYLDLNAMYSWSMQRHLPVKNFKWCNNFNVSELDNLSADGEDGLWAEVDLDYPAHLHELHKDLPLAPTNEIPPLPSSKVPKLLATLSPKKKYVVHFVALQQYLRLGLRITKVHRVLKFKQSPCLKMYMELNAELRQTATTGLQKKLRKDFSNIIFGRSIMSVRKQRDIRIVEKYGGRGGARSLIARPNFYNATILGDVVLIEMRRQSVLFNKPIYLGCAILDISKTLLYDFYYEFLKKEVGNAVSYLYGDTDSCILSLKEDPYVIIKNNPDRFDTSEYAVDNPYQIPLLNHKKVGIMKDESNGKPIIEFIGLRSKLYAYIVADENVGNKKRVYMRAKGVKKCVMKEITFDDYKRCLEEQVILSKKQNTIKSKNHDVYTIETEKIALSALDDKRQLIPGSHETLPWGYIETL